MIGSVSNYTSYTSTSSTTQNARSQQLQKELFAKLDSNGDGAVDQDELKSALSQKSDDGLLVNLSKQFGDLDSDASGSLSIEEMTAMAPPPPPQDQAPNTDLADALISALDADGDGAISSDELSNGLTSAGSSADSNQIFSALDKNKDGTVSQDELTASLTPPPPPPPQQASSNELFSQLDADGDGSISETELSSALQSSDSASTSSTDTSAALLKVLDSDSSGGVNSDELKAALQAGRDRPPEEQTTSTQTTSEALNRMIANLSKQYSLDNAAPVGKYLNVAT
ncbi:MULTISPECIES: EF-hand domain-containing protein [unclassified Pseudomonas]|uniref:EF-hand domain-containing protein n=1 Tax=unclassified Pseudomonas TaxID=196821 RepID=UPI000CCFEE94|nr:MULTISPECIES: EF-hand domain-containing protein [unclassified Pseudomonas]POA23659.1 histidine kinase [Pseudomonas sp. FW305-3-2-15-E-TSA4]POA41702.1 histidine kinase [Pseudomonas sp. FW305-3-2-15-E-TSA2]